MLTSSLPPNRANASPEGSLGYPASQSAPPATSRTNLVPQVQDTRIATPDLPPILHWYEGCLLDENGEPAQVPMDAQGLVHYRLASQGSLQSITAPGPLYTGMEPIPGETTLEFTQRYYDTDPDFRGPGYNQAGR